MRSITELSKYIDCCPLSLNKIFLKNEIDVIGEFGVNDGFISEDIDDFIRERFDYQLNSIISIEEIINKKSVLIPIIDGAYIYFLLQDNEIVYVGQSNQLAGRIQSHLNTYSKVFNFVSVFKVDNKMLNDIEQIHIYILNPKLNKTKYSKMLLVENIVKRYRY